MHDERPVIVVQHPAHERLEHVPAHRVLWFEWGNAVGPVMHTSTELRFPSRRDPAFLAVREGLRGTGAPEGEPFVVPLAIPLIAGPSTLAALLLLQRTEPGASWDLWIAVTVAWGLTAVILIAAPFFYRVLRQRGLIAMERLMGMLLVMISVQMFMNGIKSS